MRRPPKYRSNHYDRTVVEKARLSGNQTRRRNSRITRQLSIRRAHLGKYFRLTLNCVLAAGLVTGSLSFLNWHRTIDATRQGSTPAVAAVAITCSIVFYFVAACFIGKFSLARFAKFAASCWMLLILQWVLRVTPDHDHFSGLVLVVPFGLAIVQGVAVLRQTQKEIQQFAAEAVYGMALITGLLWLWLATAIGPPIPVTPALFVVVVGFANSFTRRQKSVAIFLVVVCAIASYPATAERFRQIETTESRCLHWPVGNGPTACPVIDEEGNDVYFIDGALYVRKVIVHVPSGAKIHGLDCPHLKRGATHIGRNWWLVNDSTDRRPNPFTIQSCKDAPD
jgi:uncharacterized membrane protein YidH (DUF202 family)